MRTIPKNAANATAHPENHISLSCRKSAATGRASQRTAAIATTFGLPMFEKTITILDHCEIRVGPGRIILVVGPSGSGKTTALGQIESRLPGGRNVSRMRFPKDCAIVDMVAPWDTLGEATAALTSCGLGEARLWVRPAHALSDGETFRAKLARAVADHTRSTVSAPLICDEFCSILHRRVAKAISFSLRKLATRQGLCFVLACSNEDIIPDLQPDTIVRLSGGGAVSVQEQTIRTSKPTSLRRRLVIESGKKADYLQFAAMHYRATDELGFVDKVFVMRERKGGELLGIVVYSHGPLELALRNRATRGWFSRNPGLVNRSLRILRRLVIHPDVRGCGLGHYFVRKTLPLVGTDYVECLATMGAFNPVFERAGMERIGQYDIQAGPKKALTELESMGVDPNAREFISKVGRQSRIRKIVARVVFQWYAATTAGGERRVVRQSPQFLAQTFRSLVGSRPVYYLWRKKSTSKVRKRCA
jgi:uncharacterized protein